MVKNLILEAHKLQEDIVCLFLLKNRISGQHNNLLVTDYLLTLKNRISGQHNNLLVTDYLLMLKNLILETDKHLQNIRIL
jgi:hypothetical protein